MKNKDKIFGIPMSSLGGVQACRKWRGMVAVAAPKICRERERERKKKEEKGGKRQKRGKKGRRELKGKTYYGCKTPL